MPNTKAGALVQMPGPVKVTSIGQSPTTGWTTVHRFPGASLPSGDGSYRFVVALQVGAPDWLGTLEPTWAMIEVAIGRQGVGHIPSTVSSFFLNHFERGRGACLPLLFIVDPTADDPALNFASSTLEIRARIRGDLEETYFPGRLAVAQPSFEVRSCNVMAFDLAVIAGDAQHYDGVVVNADNDGHLAAAYPDGGFKPWTSPTTFFGADGEQWLVFHEFLHSPDTAPSHIDVLQKTAGGASESVMGWTQSQGNGFFGVGPTGHTQFPNGSPSRFTRLALGGFHLSTLSEEVRMDFRSRDEHDNTLGNAGRFSRFHRWRHFAVRTDAFPIHHAYDRTDTATNTAAGGLLYPNGQAPGNERTWWMFRPFANSLPQNIVMLGQSIRRTNAGGPMPYRLDLEIESGQPLALGAYVAADRGEGLPQIAVGAETGFRAGDERTAMRLTLDPAVAAGGVHFIADDVQFFGFDWETSPEALDLSKAVPGPRVYLEPGKEIADASGLPTWPTPPTNQFEPEVDLPLHEMVAHNGTRITAPAFLTVRQRPITWSWQGLTLTKRQALEVFLEEIAGSAIRWRAPDDDADRIYVVLAPAEPFRHTGGGLYSWTAKAVELVYGGGITPQEVP